MDEPQRATGLRVNQAAALSYLLGWITGLALFTLERKVDFVRFHAMQSIILFGSVTLVCAILWALLKVPYVNILFMLLLSFVGLFAFVVWIILMAKAYQGDRFRLPVVGTMAERYSKTGQAQTTASE
jgi:uncharacterized membrane protein